MWPPVQISVIIFCGIFGRFFIFSPYNNDNKIVKYSNETITMFWYSILSYIFNSIDRKIKKNKYFK